ncbi:MAG: DUF4136 domain-containing protein [Bacteroidales bacterium]|nr:DUF4136 domain-containing protein [Bacteroidales bacterium]
MMKRITKMLLVFIAIATITTSCYKTETVYYEDYDMVLTYYDTKFDFTTYKTFYIRDSVGMISDYIKVDDTNWKSFYAPGGASPQIRNEVARQLKAYGYTQVMDSLQDADVAINLVATLIKTEGAVYYPGYWGGYPGYWGGYYSGWGWGYGSYYPWYGGSTYYQYKTANLMVEMADGDSLRSLIHYIENTPGADPTDPNAPTMKYVWQAFVNGIQTEKNTYDMERILNGIDQSFKQSEYLKLN